MNGRFLLDTNIIIELFSNNQKIAERLKNSLKFFIPCISIGELYFGAFNSRNPKNNIKIIEEFMRENKILPCDSVTAKKYGQIKTKLKEIGKPIPENDIWIAALSMQYNLTLITRDSHFQHIAGLEYETG